MEEIFMKIISDYKELRDQTFDTVEACQEAEAAIDAKKAKEAEAQKPYETAITEARDNLVRARNALRDAEGEADAIMKEAQAKAKEKLCPARKNVREAEMAVMKAIEEYNKNVGPYRVDIKELPLPIDRIIMDMLRHI
jgi:predicted  nucleic acid-binding Zn-ribbon protein